MGRLLSFLIRCDKRRVQANIGNHESETLWLTQLNLPCALLPELQRYKDTVKCAALSAEVPGHHQQQLAQTLTVRLLKTHFFYIDP